MNTPISATPTSRKAVMRQPYPGHLAQQELRAAHRLGQDAHNGLVFLFPVHRGRPEDDAEEDGEDGPGTEEVVQQAGLPRADIGRIEFRHLVHQGVETVAVAQQNKHKNKEQQVEDLPG
ncbi:MAG: hypothetical protein U5K31_15080 [Balneolaceae bacterium]|nr:hypothetical protein [Balneolaceae bacterium]